ncbi:MAG: tail-specific protease [Verrucomicrobiales bacterium]|nr:tail-specific protease [Verrucomicrobiales bacterium]|tara:strand:+ start:3945 stop:6209 length:2265 start_codon:yes stop_codon:yes gene_type:complete
MNPKKLIGFLCLALISQTASGVKFNERQLEAISQKVSQILDGAHYADRSIDDETSRMHLDFYIDSFDYFHMFFIQPDIDEFRSRYGKVLDEKTLSGDVSPSKVIFKRFLQRLKEANGRITELLETEFDFTEEERFQPNRHELGWPKDETAAEDLWRKRIKWELLGDVLRVKKDAGDEKRTEAIEKAKERIGKRYQRLVRMYEKWDTSEVLQNYLSALGRTFDPHSIYMAPADAENFDIHNVKMQLTGIGAVLREEDGYTRIVSLSPGGPALKSKQLKPEDRIIAVGQTNSEPVDVVDMKLSDVVQLIRGPKGAEVRLTVIPAAGDEADTKIVKIIRDVIKIQEGLARGFIIENPDQSGRARKLGIVDLPSFYEHAGRDVARLIARMKKENIGGLVLDLRRNGGGLLDQAVELAGLFIEQGPVVQVRAYTGQTRRLHDTDKSVAYDGPLLVLVGKHSASASEIVAGALQDYGRALIVGDIHTHGKGTVQTLYPLSGAIDRRIISDPGKLKFTVQKFYRIAGNSTQKDGVTPDIILPNVLNHLESGEAFLPNVMESDSIKAAKYENQHRISPYLNRLRVMSEERRLEDKDFKYIDEDIEQVKAQQADKTVSLNEAERRAESKQRKDSIDKRIAERRTRNPIEEKVTLLKWKKQDEKETIEVITKPGADPYLRAPDEEEEESEDKDAKFEVKTEKDKKDDKPKESKKPEKADDEEEIEPTVPAIMRDIHLREAVAILKDFVVLSESAHLAAEKRIAK